VIAPADKGREIPMSELNAGAMVELTDTELEAVSGGFLDF